MTFFVPCLHILATDSWTNFSTWTDWVGHTWTLSHHFSPLSSPPFPFFSSILVCVLRFLQRGLALPFVDTNTYNSVSGIGTHPSHTTLNLCLQPQVFFLTSCSPYFLTQDLLLAWTSGWPSPGDLFVFPVLKLVCFFQDRVSLCWQPELSWDWLCKPG